MSTQNQRNSCSDIWMNFSNTPATGNCSTCPHDLQAHLRAPDAYVNMSNSLINLGDLAKPANTLIEKISEAGIGLFAPWQIKRVAKADAAAAFDKGGSCNSDNRPASTSRVSIY